jgi:LPXTG-site transpeptidase (sortase) family protein
MNKNPLIPEPDQPAQDPAVELIRAKVSRAYSHEPEASAELAEVRTEKRALSKHQIYMQELGSTGKSLAEVQTAWHHYYTRLNDAEKHEVWQEFYDANQHTPYQKLFQKQHAVASRKRLEPPKHTEEAQTEESTGHSATPTVTPAQFTVADHTPAPEPAQSATRALAAGDTKAATRVLKHKIANTVSGNGKLQAKHHLQSLAFGLLSGLVVLILFLFTFFNEYIIAPFIQPSRNVSSTPIILGNSSVSADAPPSVTVPKINIQIPINFSVASEDETVIENGLKSGAIHYPSTVLPGQNGNAAYFGHSSGNIFNNGKYKFAFTLLHDLTTGDLFYITYGGKTYAYRIFDREIVPPSAVGVINDTKGKQATATLITCDPPGISTNRLVLWGEQISPDPAQNSAAPTTTSTPEATSLASNGPTLWTQMVRAIEFWKH